MDDMNNTFTRKSLKTGKLQKIHALVLAAGLESVLFSD